MGNNKVSFEARYLRGYRKRNPDKAEQWRTTSEINHLKSLGYRIIPPERKQPEEMTLKELESHYDRAKQAKREYMRRYVDKNREKIREYQREYRRTHPEKKDPAKQREAVRRWKENHAEEVNEYLREWKAKNPEKVREYRRKWREKNPDYNKRRKERFQQAIEKARHEHMNGIREEESK